MFYQGYHLTVLTGGKPKKFQYSPQLSTINDYTTTCSTPHLIYPLIVTNYLTYLSSFFWNQCFFSEVLHLLHLLHPELSTY